MGQQYSIRCIVSRHTVTCLVAVSYTHLNVFLFTGGAAYCLGSPSRDCWYLYTLNSPNSVANKNNVEPDQTLEVLMTDLDPEVMRIFTREGSSSAAEATQVLFEPATTLTLQKNC